MRPARTQVPRLLRTAPPGLRGRGALQPVDGAGTWVRQHRVGPMSLTAAARRPGVRERLSTGRRSEPSYMTGRWHLCRSPATGAGFRRWLLIAAAPTDRRGWPSTCVSARPYTTAGQLVRASAGASWADRGMLRLRQERDRPGPDQVAANAWTAHHPGHAGPRLPRRGRRHRPKARAAWSPSPLPRSAVSWHTLTSSAATRSLGSRSRLVTPPARPPGPRHAAATAWRRWLIHIARNVAVVLVRQRHFVIFDVTGVNGAATA